MQQRAIEALAGRERNDATVEAAARSLRRNSSRRSRRRNCVWTLARIDDPAARSLVREFLSDSDETVRQAAIHVTGLCARPRGSAPLIELLESPSCHNRRAAAEALGRIGDKSAVPALLEAAGQSTIAFSNIRSPTP